MLKAEIVELFAKTVKAEIMNIIVDVFSPSGSVFVVVRYGDDLMIYLFTMSGGWGGVGVCTRSNTVSQRPRLRSHARFLHIAYCVSGVWKSANTQTINQLIRSASERFAAYKFTQGLLANIN